MVWCGVVWCGVGEKEAGREGGGGGRKRLDEEKGLSSNEKERQSIIETERDRETERQTRQRERARDRETDATKTINSANSHVRRQLGVKGRAAAVLVNGGLVVDGHIGEGVHRDDDVADVGLKHVTQKVYVKERKKKKREREREREESGEIERRREKESIQTIFFVRATHIDLISLKQGLGVEDDVILSDIGEQNEIVHGLASLGSTEASA